VENVTKLHWSACDAPRLVQRRSSKHGQRLGILIAALLLHASGNPETSLAAVAAPRQPSTFEHDDARARLLSPEAPVERPGGSGKLAGRAL
jgi:hypothetical protein